MSKRSIFLRSAIVLTPAEARAGRMLRAPDGHPAAPAAPAAEPVPAAEPAPAAPAPAAEPAPAAQPSIDDLYDQEFGGGTHAEEAKPDEVAPAEKPEAEGASEPAEPKGAEPSPADAWEEEKRELLERLERLESSSKKDDKPAPEGEDEKSARDPDAAPSPDDYEFGEADSRFIADFARWNARAEVRAAQEEAQLDAELKGIETGWETAKSSDEISTLYPDFEEKVTKGAEKQSWLCTPLMALAIKTSEVGPHVAYKLATEPAEAARIAGLIPVEQAREIGKLEGMFAASKAAPAPKPTPKLSSEAPQPPQSRSRGAGGQFVNDADAVYDRMLREF